MHCLRLATSLLLASLCCTAPPPHSDDQGLVLPFWAGPGSRAGRSGVLEIYQHPTCTGLVALARVQRMPELPGATLIPEKAIEFDSMSQVVAQWALPIDTFIVAVRGDEIAVSSPLGSLFFVSSTGLIRETGVPDLVPPRTPRKCPASLIQGSEYRRCFAFEDLASGATRSLAFEGPCT